MFSLVSTNNDKFVKNLSTSSSYNVTVRERERERSDNDQRQIATNSLIFIIISIDRLISSLLHTYNTLCTILTTSHTISPHEVSHINT